MVAAIGLCCSLLCGGAFIAGQVSVAPDKGDNAFCRADDCTPTDCAYDVIALMKGRESLVAVTPEVKGIYRRSARYAMRENGKHPFDPPSAVVDDTALQMIDSDCRARFSGQ